MIQFFSEFVDACLQLALLSLLDTLTVLTQLHTSIKALLKLIHLYELFSDCGTDFSYAASEVEFCLLVHCCKLLGLLSKCKRKCWYHLNAQISDQDLLYCTLWVFSVDTILTDTNSLLSFQLFNLPLKTVLNLHDTLIKLLLQ